MKIIPFQAELSPLLPLVVGNADYTRFKATLERIDRILQVGGIEKRFVELRLEQYEKESAELAVQTGKAQKELKGKNLARFIKHSVEALRCNVAWELTGESTRKFSQRLADSPLFQWFCGIDRLEVVRVPSKSSLDRYEKLVPEELISEVIDELNRSASGAEATAPEGLNLQDSLDLSEYFVDTSCVNANIHFPVDWVLLRDGTRTLIKAVKLIRKAGLKNRMGEPAEFIKQMNRLSIQMTHTRRRREGKRMRKQILRAMKKLLKKIDRHAQKHRELLAEGWPQTELKEGHAREILARIDGVREQLPAAIKQAHERIIGERLVANADKILSLYEPDAHVIVRGKADAEVEFGNTLLLGEQKDGVIVDWELIQDQAAADSRVLMPSVRRVKEALGPDAAGAVVGDRGFDSQANRKELAAEEIFNGLCPKGARELSERMKQKRFGDLQRRRAQTEGRIAILQNGFLGRPLRSKGFGNRERQVGWAVLAHNLWVIARLSEAEEPPAKIAA